MRTSILDAPDPAGAPLAEHGWARVLRVSLARALLTLVVSLLVWSLVPAFVGWTPRLIMSGSMEPNIVPGDVVVTRMVPAETLTRGQVITIKDPDRLGRTRTHRLVGRDTEGRLVLRGDAGQHSDSSHVPVTSVLGLGVLRIPFIGRPLYWVTEGNWLALLGLMVGAGWCVATVFPRPHRSTGGRTGQSRPLRRSRRSRRVRAVTVLTAVVLAATTTEGPADAAFLRSTANPTSTLAASGDFYPYRTVVLSDAPYLLWRLSETTGTVITDAGASGRNGTMTCTLCAQAQAGALASEPLNTALYVTYARIDANASSVGPAAFSIEAWIKSTSTAGGRILGFGDSATATSAITDRQLYLAPSGQVYFGVGSAKTAIASLAAINNNAWHHVVGTYASGTNGMKLYVDGVLQNSATATPVSMTGYWRAAAERLVGWQGNPTGDFYAGTLDELAVYTTTLSQARVQAHYNAGITP